MSWSTKKSKREAEKADPPEDYNAFVVPNYQRGAPYVQANPVYTEHPSITRKKSKHEYESVTEQQHESGKAQYPEAGRPPGWYRFYRSDSWQRSQREEHVLNADEGPIIHQWDKRAGSQNPYYVPNIVERPQRSPHEYSFVRLFDRMLGARNLSGEHYSQATLGMSSAPLKGMTPPMHRRSTHRLDPSQIDVTDTTGEYVPGLTFSSPGSAPGPSRAYRLS